MTSPPRPVGAAPIGAPSSRFRTAFGSFDLAGTVGYRLLALVVGFGINLAAAAVLTDRFGASGYALFALLVSLLAAIPFADLGLGVSVVNATADRVAGRIDRARHTAVLASTARLLAGVTVVIAAMGAILLLTGGWPKVLGVVGDDPDGAQVAFVITLLLGLSVPLGIGSRLLEGLGRVRVLTQLSFAGSAVQLLGLVVCASVQAPAAWFSVGPAVGILVNSLLASAVGLRMLRLRARDVLRTRRPRFATEYRPSRTALPYMITIISVAIALQLDRILLAAVSTVDALAEYSFVAQFSTAVMSVITLASLNLWPLYRGRLASGQLQRERTLEKHLLVFALLGGVGAIGTMACVLLLAPIATSGTVSVRWETLLTAAALILAWSLARPATMLLNDGPGLWFQAAWCVPMATVNLVLTLWWGSLWGAPGAFAASALSLLLLQSIPLTVRSRALVRAARSGGADRR